MENVFSSTIFLKIENKMLELEQDKIDCRRIPNGNIEKSFHRFFSQTLESLFYSRQNSTYECCSISKRRKMFTF